jgi:hypothetical protein
MLLISNGPTDTSPNVVGTVIGIIFGISESLKQLAEYQAARF